VCALRRENRVGSIQPPCTTAKGMYLVGARKQELPGATLLGNAVDVTWKRNGGEHAWSFLRISRVFDISSTKRRCPGCIGCEQTAAKRDGRPKSASMGTGLSDVDISHDQSSRWQKFAAVPEEIFEREVQGKTHSCRRPVSISQSCSRKRTSAAPGGHTGFVP
jgi:hypothetical protein